MDRARVQIWFSSYFFHSPAPRFPDLVTSQQKWCSDKHVIIARKHDCECISWFMGTINILKVVRACLIAWNLGFNSLCLYIFFNFLLFFQCYYFFDFIIFSILLFFRCYYFFNFIIFSMLLFFQCYYFFDFIIFSMLLFFQFYYFFNVIIFSILSCRRKRDINFSRLFATKTNISKFQFDPECSSV